MKGAGFNWMQRLVHPNSRGAFHARLDGRLTGLAMTHAVTRPRKPFLSVSGTLEIHQLCSASDNLIWLVVCRETGAAGVVDGPEAATVLAYCKAHGIRLTAVLNTHTHPDHIGINRDLQRQHRLRTLRVIGPASRAEDVPGITEHVDDGDRFQLGDSIGHVWLTEGHLDGHISFLIDGVLFCGDTMFGGGCGRLFDGPAAKMHASLQRIAALPAETLVCCGHEYTQDNLRFAWMIDRDNEALRDRIQTVWNVRRLGGCTVPFTVGIERATNPFVRVAEPSIRWAVGEEFPALDTADPAAVLGALREWKNRGDHRAMPEDVFPV